MISAALLLLSSSLVVQQPAPAAPATPVTLTLQLSGGRRQFRPGEIIPFELTFSSETPKRFTVDGATYDRSGRLTIDEFTAFAAARGLSIKRR